MSYCHIAQIQFLFGFEQSEIESNGIYDETPLRGRLNRGARG